MSYFHAFMVGVAGAALFAAATILLTIFAAYMNDDPSIQGAYGFSLLLTVPISAAVGLAFGLYLGLG